jgi:hypothetical protein
MIIQNVIKNDVFLRCFSYFLGQKSLKKNWKQHNSTKLDKGFRLVYELLYVVEEKFWSIFAHKGGTYQKKKWKFFSQPATFDCKKNYQNILSRTGFIKAQGLSP